jgi:asparagine N-glycosylation enzyme membrane subunit Stt3
MDPKTKRLIITLTVLIVPFIILGILYPILPARIPTGHHLFGNDYIAKEFVFIFGIIPFLIYLKYRKKENK